jgi:tetratricopeptide (TPR) repeat protein
LRNRSPETRFLASHSLSHACHLGGDIDKALFYARLANRHAKASANVGHLITSHCEIGNLLLARSQFDPARSEFEAALALLPPDPSLRRAITLDFLGYCHATQGRFRKAFRHVFESLRICRRLGEAVYRPKDRFALAAPSLRISPRLGGSIFEISPRNTLAYAYLQIGRCHRALFHASRSLALCEELGDRASLKHALFLLGEGYKMLGNPVLARRYYQRLQQEYYPEAPGVADLLLVLNVQGMVNIKA